MNKIYFNNIWSNSSSKKTFYNKSFLNKKRILYPDCNKKDLNKVIKSASLGHKLYKNYNLRTRAQLIKKAASLIKKNIKKIAKYETEETGKKLFNAENEIKNSLKIWQYVTKNVDSIKANTIRKNKKVIGKIFYEPVGTVALIIPWNYPFIVMSERLPFILAGGNSVIIKPSEFASKSLVYFIKLIEKVGFPEGTINIIYGKGHKIGSSLVSNKQVDMISFTGSTATGKKIMNAASSSIKRLSLELGGKNSILILDDKNINKYIKIVIDSFCANSGQACVATTKLLVKKSLSNVFVNLLIKKLKKIRNFKKILGPITTKKQFNDIHKVLKLNSSYDKNIIFGSKEIRKDQYILPVVYYGLPEKNIINTKEIFGPILSILTFESDQEAIRLANDTNYGLSSIICCKNKQKAETVARQITSGRIWINNSISKSHPSLPIGGFKESGFNRECGLEGFRTYTEIKSIVT